MLEAISNFPILETLFAASLVWAIISLAYAHFYPPAEDDAIGFDENAHDCCKLCAGTGWFRDYQERCLVKCNCTKREGE